MSEDCELKKSLQWFPLQGTYQSETGYWKNQIYIRHLGLSGQWVTLMHHAVSSSAVE